MKADTYYEWEAPRSVRLEWVEDGGPLARLIVTCQDGSADVIEVVEVNAKETP